MAKEIRIGMYGAYLVDDRMRYYLVRWTSDPWLVENGSLETDGGLAREGEWVCKGVWMNDRNRAPRWYWQSEKEVVVRCQSILCSDVQLFEHSSDNDFPKMNGQYRLSVLALTAAGALYTAAGALHCRHPLCAAATATDAATAALPPPSFHCLRNNTLS